MNPRLVEPGFAVVCLHADVPARPGKDENREDAVDAVQVARQHGSRQDTCAAGRRARPRGTTDRGGTSRQRIELHAGRADTLVIRQRHARIADSVRTDQLVPPERARPPGALLAHEVRPEEQPRLIGIVRAATQLDVLFRRHSAYGVRLHVVELEERALTAASFGPDERAAPTITSPHGAPHRRRDVARGSRAWRGRACAFSLGETLAFELVDQERHGAIENFGGIPRRHDVTQ